MAKWTLPMDGGCRCSQVRFRVAQPPMLTMACHCSGCQKMTGSAFSTTLAVPTNGFMVTQGEPVIGGLHDDRLHHHHCGWCKSWLFTQIVPGRGFVNVRATMLDDPAWFAPFVDKYTSEALRWAKTGAPRSYPQFAPIEDYEALLADFAAW